ncbi:MAG: SDR family NAD(P)-dependent oxidoreductase [Gammaproteobacteria bacterium]|nr:SDR family NAD(P)-dependent oxidoreductase [Gammaproteobacteria bacterium]
MTTQKTTHRQRTWLITGVSSGLGRALAHAALARGDLVAGTARSAADAQAFAAQAPSRSCALVLDVTDTASIPQVIATAEQALGPVDVLVNNAGYQLVGAVEELGLDELRAQFEVNVFAALAVTQAVLPGMRTRGHGHIVNISSVSGLATWAGTGGYCASKFALEALGETLAQEVGPLGIRVTNVAPGGLRTDFTGRSLQRAARRIEDYQATAHESERIIASYRGNEPGDPDKVAAAVIGLVDMPEPPLHLLLGADALYYHGRKAGALQSEIAQWAPLSLSTAADD